MMLIAKTLAQHNAIINTGHCVKPLKKRQKL